MTKGFLKGQIKGRDFFVWNSRMIGIVYYDDSPSPLFSHFALHVLFCSRKKTGTVKILDIDQTGLCVAWRCIIIWGLSVDLEIQFFTLICLRKFFTSIAFSLTLSHIKYSWWENPWWYRYERLFLALLAEKVVFS